MQPEASQRPKVLHQGKEYDFVFDVDTEEGKPPLKLPYNLTEDIYQAATKFLNDNNLPISYLESVAGFIRENTKDATPARSSANAPASSQQSTTRSVATYLPHTEYLALTQARLEPAFKKLKEFNAEHIKTGNKHMALNPDNLASLASLVQALASAQNREGLPNAELSRQIISTIITQWPYGNRLPALDILRCMAARQGVASLADRRYGNLLDVALRGALDTEQPVGDGAGLTDFVAGVDWSQVNPNNLMMVFRAVVNLFLTQEGRELAIKEAGAVISLMVRVSGAEEGKAAVGASNNNLQAALVTAAFNYACFAYNERRKSLPEAAIDFERLTQLFGVTEAVIRQQSDAEVLFRACMAAGMIIASDSDSKELAKALSVEEWLNVAANKNADPRIKTVVAECSTYLKQ